MAVMERLNGTLQENIISLLAHSDSNGRVVASAVNPALFEGEYRVIAERCIDYWARYGEAPKDHTPDLFDDIMSDQKNRKGKTYARILNSMMGIYDGINVKYVIDQLHIFVRMQRFKDAILKSAEQLNSEAEIAVAEVERMWSELLRDRITTAEPATTLRDHKKLMLYLETQYAEFVTGVRPLDDAEIVPARGTVLLFLAAAKRGKSWFLVNVSIKNLLQLKKVVYFTLEMDEVQVLQRHYQALFSIAKHSREMTKRTLVRDDEGRLAGIGSEDVLLDYSLMGAGAEDNLRVEVNRLGARADNLRIKRFPNRGASVADLEAYLDQLEVEGFIPDLIVLDYVGILKADPKNPRIAMGRNLEEFRALGIRHNAAAVTAGQLSKEGAEAMQAGSTNVAEDWSMIGTADICLVFSSTDAEKALGLGRCKVTNARDAEDNFGVLMTQSYASGQFCMDAIRLNAGYFDMLDDLKREYDLPDDPDEPEEPED